MHNGLTRHSSNVISVPVQPPHQPMSWSNPQLSPRPSLAPWHTSALFQPWQYGPQYNTVINAPPFWGSPQQTLQPPTGTAFYSVPNMQNNGHVFAGPPHSNYPPNTVTQSVSPMFSESSFPKLILEPPETASNVGNPPGNETITEETVFELNGRGVVPGVLADEFAVSRHTDQLSYLGIPHRPVTQLSCNITDTPGSNLLLDRDQATKIYKSIGNLKEWFFDPQELEGMATVSRTLDRNSHGELGSGDFWHHMTRAFEFVEKPSMSSPMRKRNLTMSSEPIPIPSRSEERPPAATDMIRSPIVVLNAPCAALVALVVPKPRRNKQPRSQRPAVIVPLTRLATTPLSPVVPPLTVQSPRPASPVVRTTSACRPRSACLTYSQRVARLTPPIRPVSIKQRKIAPVRKQGDSPNSPMPRCRVAMSYGGCSERFFRLATPIIEPVREGAVTVVELQVDDFTAGSIIGAGGEAIHHIRRACQCSIFIQPQSRQCRYRRITLSGSRRTVEAALMLFAAELQSRAGCLVEMGRGHSVHVEIIEKPDDFQPDSADMTAVRLTPSPQGAPSVELEMRRLVSEGSCAQSEDSARNGRQDEEGGGVWVQVSHKKQTRRLKKAAKLASLAHDAAGGSKIANSTQKNIQYNNTSSNNDALKIVKSDSNRKDAYYRVDNFDHHSSSLKSNRVKPSEASFLSRLFFRSNSYANVSANECANFRSNSKCCGEWPLPCRSGLSNQCIIWRSCWSSGWSWYCIKSCLVAWPIDR